MTAFGSALIAFLFTVSHPNYVIDSDIRYRSSLSINSRIGSNNQRYSKLVLSLASWRWWGPKGVEGAMTRFSSYYSTLNFIRSANLNSEFCPIIDSDDNHTESIMTTLVRIC